MKSVHSKAGGSPAATRAYLIAWGFALVFYFLEYAVRSAPAVMLPELSAAFTRTAVGVSAILGTYYYTYSTTSLLAGVLLDRAGAKYAVPAGVFILGIGCLLFALPHAATGYTGRLLQGAGSAFAFTGAVYLATHGFSARSLATAIGFTQCLGMLGGSAGQFIVGPWLHNGLSYAGFWIGIGIITLLTGVALLLVTPREHKQSTGAPLSIFAPYRIVFSNMQSYLCGIVSGLLFAPTTIFAMTWGVAFLQQDRGLNDRAATIACAMVPMGWVLGCPLLGWLADLMGRRKPALLAGMALMILSMIQLLFLPWLLPVAITLFILGVASGAAMIPYTIIKEANPDEVKGSATGAINFITFGVTALIGPLFAANLGRQLSTAAGEMHFRQAGLFWIGCIALAIVLGFFLHETGSTIRQRNKAT